MSPDASARLHAFAQLILARVREFFREPEVIFWVYGFPLILATVLGIAFASGEPSPPTVDVERLTADPPDVKAPDAKDLYFGAAVVSVVSG